MAVENAFKYGNSGRISSRTNSECSALVSCDTDSGCSRRSRFALSDWEFDDNKRSEREAPWEASESDTNHLPAMVFNRML